MIRGQQYQKQKRKKNRRNARVVLNQKQTRSSSQHSRGDYHVGERGEGARMLQDQLPNDPLRWAAAEITHLSCCNGCHLVRRKVATWAAAEVTCAATEDALPSRAASEVTHLSGRGSRLPELPRRKHWSRVLPRGVTHLIGRGSRLPELPRRKHWSRVPPRGVTHLICRGSHSPDLPRSCHRVCHEGHLPGLPWRPPT